jgi:Site-specific recombinases, DNA invertase Pin homologs
MNKTKAIILSRVSTKDQQRLGSSLEAQNLKSKQYAQKLNFDVVKIFSFSESAGPKIRKKFEELLEYLRKNKDVRNIIAENVDRITRNFRDSVDIDDMRINDGLIIHLVQEGIILDARADSNKLFAWESKVFFGKQQLNRISEDVRRSYDYETKNGKWQSKAPIGYKNIRNEFGKSDIILDNERAFLIRRAFEDYSTGNYSLSELTKRLKEYGLTNNTINQKPLHKSQVHFLLNNPFYFGLMRCKDKLIPHFYKPIIDKVLFDKCQEVKNRLSKKHFKYSDKPFIFRGLIRCAYCDCMISTDRKKDKYNYLYCSKYKGNCPSLRIKEEEILEQVKEILKKLIVPKNILEDLILELRKQKETEEEFQKKEMDLISQELKKNQKRLSNLLDLKIDDSITQDEYDKKGMELRQRQDELRDNLNILNISEEEYSLSLIKLIDMASKAYEIFESSEVEQKRQIINFVLTNLKLRGKTLEFELKKPFDVLINLSNCENRSNWLEREDSNQNMIY